MISSTASKNGENRTLKDDVLTSLKLKLSVYAFLIFGAFSSQASDDDVDLQAVKFVPPKLQEQKTPVYPKLGLNTGREASVYLYFTVDVDGKTTNINVIESLGE